MRSFAHQNKEYNLLLHLQVERHDEDAIRIKVESVDEEDLDSTCLPVPPNAESSAHWLLLKGGAIILRPLPLGCTSFTFIVQVDIQAVEQFDRSDDKEAPVSSTDSLHSSIQTQAHVSITNSSDSGIKTQSSTVRSTARSTIKQRSTLISGSRAKRRLAEGARAGEILCKVAGQFYERFKKEDAVDAKRKADFIENKVPNAPPLTRDEQILISESLTMVKDISLKAKRLAGSVNDSVEKFIYRDGEAGAAWGMSVAKIDVSADNLFAKVSKCYERSDEVLRQGCSI